MPFWGFFKLPLKSRSNSRCAILAITPFDGKCNRFWQPKSRSRWRCAIFAFTPFDGTYKNLQMSPMLFCARSYRFRDINSLNVWPSKSKSKSRNAVSQLHHSMANVIAHAIGEILQNLLKTSMVPCWQLLQKCIRVLSLLWTTDDDITAWS